MLLITYEFPPSMLIGAQACAQIARYLQLYGWEPVVLTVRERNCEYSSGAPQTTFHGRVIRTCVLPHPLSIYRNVKWTLRAGADGTDDGGESSGGTPFFRRWVLSLLRIPDEHTGWICPATVAGLKVIRRLKVGHLFSSGPSWTNHLVGLVLARLTGVPWTAHFRDPWTQVPGWKSFTGLSARIESGLERMVLTHADAVVCVTDRHARLLRDTHPELPAGKFVTISNGYDGAEWDSIVGEGRNGNPSAGATFVVTFAGNLYNELTPLPIFRALQAFVESGEIDRGQIRVNLIGWCDWARGRRVTDLAAECGIRECVNVRGPLNRADIIRKLATSNLLLVLADGLPLQIPGKTYEYLRAGRPILALTSEGALADLLRRTGGAWVVDPADEAGVTAAVREAYGCWRDGRDARVADSALVAAFDRRALAGRFAELFESAIARNRRRGTGA